MAKLRERSWNSKYHADAGSLVKQFYEPALSCAVRYDRTSGYFTAGSLVLAARGIEKLVHNNGHMRLVVGCTLDEPEVEAINEGMALREAIEAKLFGEELKALDPTQADALELLAWMVARGVLDVKIAIPCGSDRRLIAGSGAIFHEKAGIIGDADGDRIAFNGSVNETWNAWSAGGAGNWESFHVFTAFGESNPHVDAEEATFGVLWNDKADHARVVDVPTAVRQGLLRHLPKGDALPRRLLVMEQVKPDPSPEKVEAPAEPKPVEGPLLVDIDELRRRVWAVIRAAPAWPKGGEWIGEATSAVDPWPHQVRAFQRMYDHWPPKLLIADEVGLGKTIEAGLVLRQAWLSGRARRILVLTPRAVLNQWQIELREKFNLNWPVYDGQILRRYRCPALGNTTERAVARDAWHKEPVVLVSSQLMRRSDRMSELLAAEPWDLVVLDEAHHARRKGAGGAGKDKGPNQLLRLMQQLKDRTQGLIMLTATPMQVHPVEVWDLLALLGLPPAWTAGAFERFFEVVGQQSPSHEDFEFLAAMFRAAEAYYGPVGSDAAKAWLEGSKLASKKVIEALRDEAQAPRRQLPSVRRKAAIAVMKTTTPVGRLVSRHTRELLRRYQSAGKLTSRIATREVEDSFVDMTPDERKVYEQVEAYISSTYNNASDKERNAVGFVMTIYRRRLASSFSALRETLADRLVAVGHDPRSVRERADRSDDVSDDETVEEVMDLDDAARLEQQSLAAEEASDIEKLLRDVRALPTDTKAKRLLEWIRKLQKANYPQVIVFTQYTDTMDFLRDYLRKQGISVMCYSGRGGEVAEASGTWGLTTRDTIKRLFRDGKSEVLLATDAAAEGLNFQFCGALINFDMPWNPMRVEQRIGRIDRLGQAFETISIVNLHYNDTVEADVYAALRARIGLFSKVVGKLQPILAALPKQIADVALGQSKDREKQRADLVQQLETEIRDHEADAFDLDEIARADLDLPPRPTPPYDLAALDALLRRHELLPSSVEVKWLAKSEYELTMPGMKEPLRITTSKERFEDNPGTYELWSPGSPLFPAPDVVAPPSEEPLPVSLVELLKQTKAS
jgi:SNF2 family DNA or RNA helicase